ncbi:MAG: hypothetical protein Q9188_001157 [Gyalolechia gomerana]
MLVVLTRTMVISASLSMIPEVRTVSQLQSLGESRVLLPAQLANLDENNGQNAAQRGQNIKQLVQAYPEIAPGSGLLSSLAETSDLVQETTAGYDPMISELLAFGRALHPQHHRNDPKTVPVVAVPGGPAGQLVRVVQLVPEIVGWEGKSSIGLKNESFSSRVQGLWSGNGSRIQQLHFARSDFEPTEWLAVRYGGATSILRPILREKEMSQLHHFSPLPGIEDVEFRLELEHIVTLTTRYSGGIPHADICFNPWNPSEFAIVDRSSCWSVWRIQSVNGTTGVWKLASGLSGQLEEPLSNGTQQPVNSEPKHDGWGAVKWISNGAGLVVCNRRNGTPDAITQNNRRFQAPNLSIKPPVKDSAEEDQGVLALEDQWTINLEWLTDYINSSPSTQFNEALRLIPGRISDRMEAVVPGIVSLEELLDHDTIVGDIEDDSVALEDLLSIIEGRSAVGHEDLAGLPEKSISTSRLGARSIHLADSLSRTYDALIMYWVSSLAARIPGRVRARTERLTRCIAAELQLASCGLRLQLKDGQREEGSQSVVNGGRATFTLVVRSIPDYSNESRRPKEKAVQRASGEAESSPISKYQSYMPAANLPTPEPTPSVNSQISCSTPSGTEGFAKNRLRSFASVASQPPLPPAVMGILSHWPVGYNPDHYDWETSKAAFEHGAKPEEDEERARVKKRQRRSHLSREHAENTVAPLSQLPIPRLSASQVERPSDLQHSSQSTLATGSQPQPGRFGSRNLVKDKKDKKPGFR